MLLILQRRSLPPILVFSVQLPYSLLNLLPSPVGHSSFAPCMFSRPYFPCSSFWFFHPRILGILPHHRLPFFHASFVRTYWSSLFIRRLLLFVSCFPSLPYSIKRLSSSLRLPSSLPLFAPFLHLPPFIFIALLPLSISPSFPLFSFSRFLALS